MGTLGRGEKQYGGDTAHQHCSDTAIKLYRIVSKQFASYSMVSETNCGEKRKLWIKLVNKRTQYMYASQSIAFSSVKYYFRLTM